MKQYVSRDRDRSCGFYDLWNGSPEWNELHEMYTSGYEHAILVKNGTDDEFEALYPQLKLEPGQLATVNREVNEGVVMLTIGKVIEEH